VAKSLYKVDRRNVRIGGEEREVIVDVQAVVDSGKMYFASNHSTDKVVIEIKFADETPANVRILVDTFQGEGKLYISMGEESPTHRELLDHGIVEVVCIAPPGPAPDSILWISNLPTISERSSDVLKSTILEWHETPPQITTIKELLG
jgi:hypothetical protein